MKRYLYCGRTLESPFVLPVAEAPEGSGIDLRILTRRVPDTLPQARVRVATYEVGAGEVLWRLPGVLRCLVREDGREVVVEVESPARAGDLATFLLLPVFALSAVMRGDFLLSAAVVARDGEAIGFLGWSGCGKSTAAAALIRHAGYRLVGDSLIRVTLDGQGRALAHPQGGGMILWPDAIEGTGIAASECRALRPGVEALRWLGAPAVEAPLPLGRLLWMPDEPAAPPPVPSARGPKAAADVLKFLAGSTWRRLADQAALLRWAVGVASAVPMAGFRGPERGEFSKFPTHVEAALATINSCP